MVTPKNRMNLNYVNEIVENTLTNEKIGIDGLDQNRIKEKYSSMEKIKNEINQKIARVNAIFVADGANDQDLNSHEKSIRNAKQQIAYWQDQLISSPTLANQIQLNLNIISNTLKNLEENPAYLALKKIKQDFSQEKKTNLIEIYNGLIKIS